MLQNVLVDSDSSEPAKGDDEVAVPVVWRPTIEAIVAAFVAGDWGLNSAPLNVTRLSSDLARAIRENVEDYGEITLVELPDDTWTSSVATWWGSKWKLLVDLWTYEEGRSDLVLDLDVYEADGGYAFNVHLVYVP